MNSTSSNSKPHRSKFPFIVSFLVLCSLGILFLQSAHKPGSSGTSQAVAETPRTASSETGRHRQHGGGHHAADFQQTMAEVMATLDSHDPDERRAALARLDKLLHDMPPDQAIALTMEFLQSGADKPTGLRFAIAKGNVLSESPSLRVFMMDQLGQLCQETQGPEAGQVAREVLAEKTSPDEWAISLRNVAWNDPDGSRSFIGQKSLDMIEYQPWAQNPSDGFLQAFDGLIYGHELDALNDLNKFRNTGAENPLDRASTVAFIRMADEFPADLAATMNKTPDILGDPNNTAFRANVFSKLDITDQTQLAELETYLSRPDVSADEKSSAVRGLLTPGDFLFYGLIDDIRPNTETEDQSHQRWANIESLVMKWEETNQHPELADAFDQVKSIVQESRVIDQMNQQRAQYIADYIAIHGGEIRDVPPYIFTSTVPTGQTQTPQAASKNPMLQQMPPK